MKSFFGQIQCIKYFPHQKIVDFFKLNKMSCLKDIVGLCYDNDKVFCVYIYIVISLSESKWNINVRVSLKQNEMVDFTSPMTQVICQHYFQIKCNN